MIKNKDYYISKYWEEYEEGMSKHAAEWGTEEGYDSLAYIYSAEAIAGYYLASCISVNPLEEWMNNLEINPEPWPTDAAVTEILRGVEL